ncbi:MAG: hypothetical protein ABI664_13860 [bacterium]
MTPQDTAVFGQIAFVVVISLGALTRMGGQRFLTKLQTATPAERVIGE